MNMILLFQDDFITERRVQLRGRRKKHIIEVLRANLGDTVFIGLKDHNTGYGRICRLENDVIELEVDLTLPPLAPLPLNLLLALPRPKVLSRIIYTATCLGIKNIWLFNAARVEKSYWQSPKLLEKNLENQKILGLEQAKDTLMPKIEKHYRFKPFVEDTLPEIMKNTLPVLAHPGGGPCPAISQNQAITLAIGPEGGFVPYEIQKLTDCGFIPVSAGNRILRVETALPFILGFLGQIY